MLRAYMLDETPPALGAAASGDLLSNRLQHQRLSRLLEAGPDPARAGGVGGFRCAENHCFHSCQRHWPL
jgi:hypothetical protein